MPIFKCGLVFTQISKTDHGFIYEVEYNGQIHYEVFKRLKRVNPYTEIEYVRYPNSNAFGIWAWICMALERAEERFDKIMVGTVNLHLQKNE